jgi:hypothetical protein
MITYDPIEKIEERGWLAARRTEREDGEISVFVPPRGAPPDICAFARGWNRFRVTSQRAHRTAEVERRLDETLAMLHEERTAS